MKTPPLNGTTPGPATRRVSLLTRIRQLVLGPSPISEQCTAELNQALQELRAVTEEGKRIVREGKAQLAAGGPQGGA